MERITTVAKHLQSEDCSSSTPSNTKAKEGEKKQQRAFPTHRQEALKWNGWGYNDSQFALNEKVNMYICIYMYIVHILSSLCVVCNSYLSFYNIHIQIYIRYIALDLKKRKYEI